MGAIKDIYDILADVTTKMQAHRLKKSGERSREELEAYTETLEASVAELQSKVENLEREHSEEVTDLKAKNQELVTTNEHHFAKIAELEAPKAPVTFNRIGTKKGW